MYGLIGKIIAVENQRESLISILLEASVELPGCLSYVVAMDSTDPDGVWVTEVWENRESHQASLNLPAVQQAISNGRALIAGFGDRFETEPVNRPG